MIKNLGVRPAKVWVKGGNWISDAAGNTIIPTILDRRSLVSLSPHLLTHIFHGIIKRR